MKQMPLIICLLLALTACSRLTAENYDRIGIAMDYDEVKQIIGEPTQCDDVLGVKQCTWGNETQHIKVSFIGGKATFMTAKNVR
jgi:hypothetical protein